MITDDDWTAFEANVLSIDTRPPIVGDCNYHDWTRCEIAEKHFNPGQVWGDRVVIVREDVV